MVDLLLDLAGSVPQNLVDAVAVEPSVGEGAFPCLMIERLIDSCWLGGRSIALCGPKTQSVRATRNEFSDDANRANRSLTRLHEDFNPQ